MTELQNEKNVYLLTGTDHASIRREALNLVQHFTGGSEDPFVLDHIRQGDSERAQDPINNVINSVLSPPFFGDYKTVYLDDFAHFDREGSKQSPVAPSLKRLAEIIEKGLPPGIVLILSGPGADQRRKLFKACKKHGQTYTYEKPEVRDRHWQQHMAESIRRTAENKGIALPEEVVTYLTDILGTDTERIDPELEKLICYCGGTDKEITLQAAHEVCQGHGEAISWSLTDALGKRQIDTALDYLETLVQQQSGSTDSVIISLLYQIAARFRDMLQIKIFMQHNRVSSPKALQKQMDDAADEQKRRWQEEGYEFVTAHPFKIFNMARQAENYSGPELISALSRLCDANWACVSNSVPNRVILEQCFFNILHKS